MKLCQIYHGVFGDWGWEHVREDGTVEESCSTFERYDECVQDAWRHGYLVHRAAASQPRLAFADSHAQTRCEIAKSAGGSVRPQAPSAAAAGCCIAPREARTQTPDFLRRTQA